MITPGSIASVITLPLVAAACNNTKTEPAPAPDPNLDQKAVTDSLNNIKIEVANKNKLPKEVKKTDITISDQVSGFTYSVESLSPNDKTGELTVKVKSTKNNLSATKDIKIEGFKKETKEDDKKDKDDMPTPPAPKVLTEAEFKAKAKFTYSGNLNTNFDKSKIELKDADGYTFKVLDFRSGLRLTGEKFYVSKLEIQKENKKQYDVYVKFSADKIEFVNKEALQELIDQELSKKITEAVADFKTKAEYKYNGQITDSAPYIFKSTNVAFKADGYTSTFVSSKTKLGDSVLAKFKIFKSDEQNVTFDVYVKFTYNMMNKKADFTTKEEYDKLAIKIELKDKIKYEGKVTIDTFNIAKIKLDDGIKDLKINVKERVIKDKKNNKIIVQISASKNSNNYLFLVEFKEGTDVAGIFINSSDVINATITNEKMELDKITFEYKGKIDNKITLEDLKKNITINGDSSNAFKVNVEKFVFASYEKNTKKIIITRIRLTTKDNKSAAIFFVEFNFNLNDSKTAGRKIDSNKIANKYISKENLSKLLAKR
ncbi:hypothetical protein DA803_01695 [[Mycoplasma] phocae]|uniref:Lipoprotein-associated type-17 domain-containing protein n=1 Tax=[Mycoplasma] phocae TaxID=142651 RepID=A0A2Z5IQE9_9BACT|nr:lipoprotein 17-related variable surface protein [[Mycoplasma] phocae]AXE60797.1 hypothetical protein DA803_01695 [[Mycoplasma] phocae]